MKYATTPTEIFSHMHVLQFGGLDSGLDCGTALTDSQKVVLVISFIMYQISSTDQPLTTKQVILAASDSPAWCLRSLVPKLLCGAEPDTLFEHAQKFWELETSGYYNNIPCIIIASFPGSFPLPVLYANTAREGLG